MECESGAEELVEVEVVPQTVTEITYLREEDLEAFEFEDQASLFVPVVTFEEDVDDDDETDSVPVDNDVLPYLTVTLHEAQEDDDEEGCAASEENLLLARSAVKCGINLYQCKLCNKRFKSWKFVSSHVVTHGEEWRENQSKKKINCTQCRMTFAEPRSLTYHVRTQHDAPRSFVCDICSCSFVSENGLAGHYRKHFHPKEFVCRICSAGYDTSVDIENHYKTHRTNLLYACNKCDAGFAGTVELSAHLRYEHPRVSGPIARRDFGAKDSNFRAPEAPPGGAGERRETQEGEAKYSNSRAPEVPPDGAGERRETQEGEAEDSSCRAPEVETTDGESAARATEMEDAADKVAKACRSASDAVECATATKAARKKRGRPKKRKGRKARKLF